MITLDLAEGDDVHREQLRKTMDEPYRTLLGHFRHEIGHYYYYRLVDPSPSYQERFGQLFGDPDADYQAALDRHYDNGPPEGWEQDYVSSYATMHPAGTGPRRSRTTCTSATPSTPRRRSGWPRRARRRPKGLGPAVFDRSSRCAAAGLVIEHGEPVDGP